MLWKGQVGMTLNRAKIIGITGGIGTGKSTVSGLLKDMGFLIIDSDLIAREVVIPGEIGYNKVVDYFGEIILNNDKTINRSKLGSIIFSKKSKRDKLNSILHPIITKAIIDNINQNLFKEKVIFIDIPLLFEVRSHLQSQGLSFDEVWLVYTKKEIQLERLIIRDNMSTKEALSKIDSQIDIEDKKKLAEIVIDNQGKKGELKSIVENLVEKYR